MQCSAATVRYVCVCGPACVLANVVGCWLCVCVGARGTLPRGWDMATARVGDEATTRVHSDCAGRPAGGQKRDPGVSYMPPRAL